MQLKEQIFHLKKAETFFLNNETKLNGWLVVSVKADYLTRDLGLGVECPPWESF